jgi:TonB-linked SusC/RagA family outer membrane protein
MVFYFKQLNSRSFIRIFCIVFILQNTCLLKAQESDPLLQTPVELTGTKLTVKQALDQLNQLPEINIVYGSNEEFLKLDITFSQKKLKLKEALDQIKLQAPVDIIFNNKHIIVRSRKLAAAYSIRGTVSDAVTREGLIAADIFLAGTSTGTVTDMHGNFSLSLKPGKYLLVCRYIGYEEKQVTVHVYQDNRLEVLLHTKQHEIDEVNVTGSMGDIEHIEKGRPIEIIEAKTINQLSTNDVNAALHGRINGVWATKVSGAPGDHHKIRIRGISSIFGSTDPLYVVDGMIIPVVNFKTLGIADLNTHDVNSITILKDASSTALYGYLGGNGVILIETKKGGGDTRYNLSVKRGYQSFAGRYPLMDAELFLNTLDSSDSKIHTPFYLISPATNTWERYPRYSDSLGNTLGTDDFQDELFRTGDISEFQLAGQGKIKGIDFYLSGNYYRHNGIITNTNYDKYSFTGNFSKIIEDRFSVRLLYKGSYQENKNNLDNYLGNNIIFKGINYEPAYRTTPDSFFYKPNRLYLNDNLSASIKTLSDHGYSPDFLFYKQEKKKTEKANSLTAQGYYRLNGNFSFRALVSLAFRENVFISFLPSQSGVENEKYLGSNENYVIFSQQYDLNYIKQIKLHEISTLVRFRNYKDDVNWEVDSIKNVEIDGISPGSDVYLRGSNAIFGERGTVIRSLNSGIVNLNYNFKKKYFVSAIVNFDHLKEGHYIEQHEIFSSIALNYDLAKEDFIPVPKWVNAFNLYINSGQAGNYPLNSLSNDLFATGSKYTSNDTVVKGVYVSNLANHYLRHEKVNETNYGAEISILGSRIIASADYYVKKYSNLLIQRSIPGYYGGGFFYQNIGEMKNSGIEVSLEIMPVDKARLQWVSKAGISTNKQHITRLYDGEPISFNSTDVLFPDFYARENESLGDITGYNYLGKWEDVEPSISETDSRRVVQHLGLAYLKTDSLNPRKITEADKTVIGNSIPDFTFNWINVIQYRNFSVEMLWYGVIGVDKYNATRASTFISGTHEEVRNIVMDTMRYHTNYVFYESSYFVEDASFIRLKTLSFTYDQKRKIASRISMQYILSFENLVTLTHYTGYDPEATIYTNNNFTDNAIDMGAYPNPRGIYLSINMTF